MRIDFLARESHFFDHLAPIWHALPAERRGTFWTSRDLARRAAQADVQAETTTITADDTVTVTASWGDLKVARKQGRPAVLAEHGAGQSYIGAEEVGSYIGATDRRGVIGVLVPGEAAAARHREVHPEIPAFVVGCPKLDSWHGRTIERRPPPVVAISFHWNCTIVPETRGAWAHYALMLPSVAQQFPGAIGHAHPKAFPRHEKRYARLGLTPVGDFDDVLELADLYVCDNSSTIYEFASTGRPVVVLNQPCYRRSVDHGGRFWAWADIGVQVDSAETLLAGIRDALNDTPERAARRNEIVAEVYGVRDGTAAGAAADALEKITAERG